MRNLSLFLSVAVLFLIPYTLYLIPFSSAQANLPGAGNCLSFNGTSDYVDVPDNNYWYFGSSDFTITAWVKLNSISSGGAIVSQWINYCSTGGQIIYFHPTLGLTWDVSCVMAFVQGNTSGWTAGQWYHVAVVRNGNNFNMYRNGLSIANTTWSGSLPNYAAPLIIGSSFPGSIDEVSIWKNKGLTQTEIRNTMCQKLVGTEPGLVGYWRFDETSGTTANDSSPNGNNGTLK